MTRGMPTRHSACAQEDLTLKLHSKAGVKNSCPQIDIELELELIQTQMAQKPMLRAEVGMRVRCANKASAE